MNKVFNINLGGYPFTIDEDAYEHLNVYLETIHRHFEDSEGYDEITTDIEARMAELFQENLGDRPIIALQNVKDAIVIMGTPEDFGAEAVEEEGSEGKSQKKTKYKTGKRLFRNPDDEVIGGVCSGVASYFGVADPIWVRLAFIAVTISGGFGIPLYIILWAVLPKAETASDKLAMRGEAINISSIGKIIEEEFEHFSTKMSEFGDELNSKKKNSSKGIDGRGALKKGVSLIGKVIRTLIEMFGKIWKPLLIIVGFALIIAFAVSWIGAIIGFFYTLPFINYLLPEQTATSLIGGLNILLLIGIPIASLILLISRLVFGTRLQTRWRVGLFVLWALNFISLGFISSLVFRDFNTGSEIRKVVDLSEVNSDTLYVNLEDNPYEDTWMRIGNELQVTENALINRHIDIMIRKADGDEFELVQVNISRGKSMSDANNLADAIDYTVGMDKENKVTFPWGFRMENGEKWRNQHVRLTLKVPVDKYVKLDGNMFTLLHRADLDDRNVNPWGEKDGRVWRMGSSGLICTNCERGGHNENLLPFQDFTSLRIDGKMKVLVEEGSEFKVSLSGNGQLTEQVDIMKVEETLNITTELEHTSSPIRLYISMPRLATIETENTDDVRIRGFNQPRLDIRSIGKYEVKASIDVDSLYLEQDSNNKFDIRGRSHFLNARLANRSQFNGEKANIQHLKMEVVKASRADLPEINESNMTIEKDESSKITIGNKDLD